jgi:hypothetical protein
MNADASPCPDCGSIQTRDVSLGGLCPTCLLRLALDAEAAAARGAPHRGEGRPAAQPGACRILTLLGSGPYGLTYLAEHDGPPRRLMTVKTVRSPLTRDQRRDRLDSLLAAQRALDHPLICPFVGGDLATDRGDIALVSAYRVGVDIARYLARTRIEPADRLRLFVSVCEAVRHAHDGGIAHGHLASSNVLVTNDQGRLCVLVQHFGVAALAAEEASVAGDSSALIALLDAIHGIPGSLDARIRGALSVRALAEAVAQMAADGDERR